MGINMFSGQFACMICMHLINSHHQDANDSKTTLCGTNFGCAQICDFFLRAFFSSYKSGHPKLTTSKTKQFYENPSIFEVDNIKNKAILRDFLQTWKVKC
jgi:hypothetical protein